MEWVLCNFCDLLRLFLRNALDDICTVLMSFIDGKTGVLYVSRQVLGLVVLWTSVSL